MSERFELVVVGAGPAGSSAAYTGAKKGLRTLLLEEHAVVGVPSHCAGILYEPNCARGGLSFPSSIVQHVCEEVQVCFGFQNRLSFPAPGFRIIDRPRLDQYLAARAVAAGAELRLLSEACGVKHSGRQRLVRVRRHEEEYEVESDVVVAADGSRYGLLKWIGISPQMEYLSSAQYEIAHAAQPDLAPIKAYFTGQLAPRGYGWIVPTGKDSVRAGVCVAGTRVGIRTYLHRIIEHELVDGFMVQQVMGGLLPTSGPIAQNFHDGIIAAGNVGGFVNPLTGAGIVSGFISGRMAGEVAAEAVAQGNTSAGTLRRFQDRISPVLGDPFRRTVPLMKTYQKLSDSSMMRMFRLVEGLRITHGFRRNNMLKAAIRAGLSDPRLALFFLNFAKARDALTL